MARIVSFVLAPLSALLVLAGAYWLLFEYDSASVTPESVAEVEGVFNTVETRPARELAFSSARVGAPLAEGDMVRTGERSRAVVGFKAGLTLNVDPTSIVVISAPHIDAEGLAVQEVRVERGSVSGEAEGGRRIVKILDASGKVAARLLSTTEGGEKLRYRYRQSDDGMAEVSILSGAADVDAGGETVSVKAGHSVSLGGTAGTSKISALPPFPRSQHPGVDARVALTAAEPRVELAWDRPPVAAHYRVQVGRAFVFDHLSTDATTDASNFAFEPTDTGAWFWRVATIDGAGRQGEYGFVRRFFVSALPDLAAPPSAALATEEEVKTPEAAEDLEEIVATEEEFDFKAQVLGRGLSRQSRGRGAFSPIAGRVKLRAKDVLKASKATGLRFGRGAVLGAEPESQLVFTRAGARDGRRVVVVELQSGGVTADLSGARAALATILIESRGARTFISGSGDKGTRARAERLPDGLRVIAERGTVRITGGGKSAELPAGYALVVPSGGAPGEPIALPAPPIPRTPENGATFVTLDSPPAVAFEWSKVKEAARYQLAISFDPDGTALAYVGEHKRVSFTHRGLRPGKYYWTVRAMSEEGVRGRPSPMQAFSILKDTKPPQVTLTSPANGITVDQANVRVVGRTERDATVKINGRKIELDDGAFSVSIDLSPGLNQIVVEAVDLANNVTFKSIKVRREGP